MTYFVTQPRLGTPGKSCLSVSAGGRDDGATSRPNPNGFGHLWPFLSIAVIIAGRTVTAEVASSSLVVPAIFFSGFGTGKPKVCTLSAHLRRSPSCVMSSSFRRTPALPWPGRGPRSGCRTGDRRHSGDGQRGSSVCRNIRCRGAARPVCSSVGWVRCRRVVAPMPGGGKAGALSLKRPPKIHLPHRYRRDSLSLRKCVQFSFWHDKPRLSTS